MNYEEIIIHGLRIIETVGRRNEQTLIPVFLVSYTDKKKKYYPKKWTTRFLINFIKGKKDESRYDLGFEDLCFEKREYIEEFFARIFDVAKEKNTALKYAIHDVAESITYPEETMPIKEKMLEDLIGLAFKCACTAEEYDIHDETVQVSIEVNEDGVITRQTGKGVSLMPYRKTPYLWDREPGDEDEIWTVLDIFFLTGGHKYLPKRGSVSHGTEEYNIIVTNRMKESYYITAVYYNRKEGSFSSKVFMSNHSEMAVPFNSEDEALDVAVKLHEITAFESFEIVEKRSWKTKYTKPLAVRIL